MLHLCFVYVLFVFCLCFACVFLMYVKILRSYFPRIRSWTFAWRKCCANKTYVRHMWNMWETSVSQWLQVCTRFGFQIGNCLTQGDGQLMFHICCKFHTHVLIYVSLLFQLYSIYVSFAFHTCFVLCLTYVSYTFHICFVYVSHMFLLTPRHSLCLRHAPSTVYRNHPWSPFGSS